MRERTSVGMWPSDPSRLGMVAIASPLERLRLEGMSSGSSTDVLRRRASTLDTRRPPACGDAALESRGG